MEPSDGSIKMDCWKNNMTKYKIGDYIVERTCSACPEQYDVFYDGRQAGYLRFRFGRFTAYYFPKDSNEWDLVYQKKDWSPLQGCFENNKDRMFYIEIALGLIDIARRNDEKSKNRD